MEKLYMNDKKKKKIKIDGTSLLSFGVAIFAIVSLIAAGFNQISFALPAVEDPLPDNFKTKEFSSATDMLFSDTWTGRQIDMHFAIVDGKNIPVFCLQQSVSFADDSQYYKKSEEPINDAGLLYLMANLYPNVTMSPSYPIQNAQLNNNHQIETWITQAAIWYYLTSTSTEPQYNALTSDDLNKIKNTHAIGFTRSVLTPAQMTGYTSYDHTLFDSYTVNSKSINKLIEEAIAKKGSPATEMNVVSDENYSISEDGKYYFSSVINVQGSVSDPSLGTYKGFSVVISNAPDGTIITDENGGEIKNLDNMAPGTKFLIRVPADKIKEATQISISVNGNFETYSGNRYSAGADTQEITTVKLVSNVVGTGYSFEIAPAPDTGITTTSTIFFVGLIVLVCGIGIVYANAKPVENQQ